MTHFLKIIFFFAVTIHLGACSLMPKWMGGSEGKPQAKAAVDLGPDGKPLTKFSENPTVLNPSNRNYRRMTKTRMEEESELHAQAGSMWVMEGQGAYLFSQNKTRREGDLLNIKIDGAAQKQIETKVAVIKKLLKQLEDQQKQDQDAANPPKLAEGAEGANQKEAARAPASEKKEDKEEPLQIEAVPTRIVEKLQDGNYRIKGAQPFMIGKREYKVLVTGVIRPEDFNDQGIPSAKLLDPQYDVVSIRRSQQ